MTRVARLAPRARVWSRSLWLVLGVMSVACAAELDPGSSDASPPKVDALGSALDITPGAAWVARHGMTSDQYQQEFDTWVGEGYRLTYVSGYEQNGEARYAALWERAGSFSWIARHGLTASQYQQEFDTNVANGYRLVLVNGYTVGGRDYFAAIWEASPSGAWVARHGMSSSEYQQEFDRLVGRGYRLVHVSGYGSRSEKYAALWQQVSGPAWIARHGMSGSQYQAAFDSYVADGYHLKLVGGYPTTRGTRYVAIWERGSANPWVARHGQTSGQYQQNFDELRYQGYRPVVVSGYASGSSARYAALWQNDAMRARDLRTIDRIVNDELAASSAPAISFAITQNGRLVFAKAYGKADVDGDVNATTASLFRIASVSKPITSTAIMRLVDRGWLELDDLVFGEGALLGTTYGSQPYSERVRSITVEHLLTHTAGGWGNSNNDPMFLDPALSLTDVIDTTLDNRPLDNEPGSAYAYSNFGYCLLGRIIEAITGETYEDWVQQDVLAPAGISNMQIGGNTLAQRKPNEVVYYGGAYGMNVTRMDAHGGWIASPIDLTRYAVHVDGFASPSDVLTPNSELLTSTGTSANPQYGLGWVLFTHGNSDRACSASSEVPCRVEWHNGSLPGTTSILVRTTGEFTWAAITNTRDNSPNIDGMMWDIVNSVEHWPAYDLF